MDKFPIFGILCGGFLLLLFGGAGIWLIIKSIQDKKKVGESAAWPSTVGTITGSTIAESVSTSDDDNITHYRPVITYTYQIAGVSYESKRLMFGAVESGSNKNAQAVVARYPIGASVPVYYNPLDAKEAVLERQSKSSSVMLILGIVFLVMALCTLCIGLVSIVLNYVPQ